MTLRECADKYGIKWWDHIEGAAVFTVLEEANRFVDYCHDQGITAWAASYEGKYIVFRYIRKDPNGPFRKLAKSLNLVITDDNVVYFNTYEATKDFQDKAIDIGIRTEPHQHPGNGGGIVYAVKQSNSE